MPSFIYSAVDRTGHPTKGRMEAVNDIDLELRLKHIGLDLITVSHADQRISLITKPSTSLQDLIEFCFEMEQLISAGIPMLQGMADLRDSTSKPAFREVISQLISAMEGGLMLSQAMAQHSATFKPVFVSLIHTGEQSGKLGEVFKQLSDALKWQDEMLAKTRHLLVYPLFILVIVLASAVFLMMYLVPQMVGFLKNMGQTIPWQTQFMITFSDGMLHWWRALLAAAVLLAVTATLAVKHIPAVHYHYDALKLRLPFTGSILQKAIMARFARYFALMYQAGIPILSALKTCEDIVGNRVVAHQLEQAYQCINAGERMSESFRKLDLFPPVVVRMIRIGESTGALDSALLNVSYFYDRDVRNSIEKMLKLLEPTLTVLLGALLAFIMFSVLGPVYEAMMGMRF